MLDTVFTGPKRKTFLFGPVLFLLYNLFGNRESGINRMLK